MKNIIFSVFITIFISTLAFAQNNLETGKKLNELLTSYYGIKNALVAEDGTTASIQADVFIKTLSEINVEKMASKEQKTWKEYADKIKFDAEHIAETKDASHQRDHFNDLSNNLFAVLKAFKVNTAEVYQQFCPMKKTYWLSESSDIKNPYYGKKMLTCGKVTETLKANK
ncbi:MAG: DUF3347 domain-containing protein [Thermoflexibacter sp.]|jgi:hypothetical protein|nr:DUF3347 domain-containing protein [Thermoflexibacter sp.]